MFGWANGVGAGEEGAVEPAATAPPLGSLVICGGGALPDAVLDEFVELAGGRSARLVVIPTASSLADSHLIETRLETWRRRAAASVTLLHTRSRDVANDEEFVRPLREASGVWFTGGMQSRVAEVYLGTAVEKLVHQVLQRGGAVGGTSAGAAIMSSVMIRRGKTTAEVGQGFGFLPGTVIDQHFLKRKRQGRLLSVLGEHPGLVGLGIDEGTALVVQGERARVVGLSQVIAYLGPHGEEPPSQQVLQPGDEIDLAALSRTALARVPRNSGSSTAGR